MFGDPVIREDGIGGPSREGFMVPGFDHRSVDYVFDACGEGGGDDVAGIGEFGGGVEGGRYVEEEAGGSCCCVLEGREVRKVAGEESCAKGFEGLGFAC